MIPRYSIQIDQSNQLGFCTAIVIRGAESGPLFTGSGPDILTVLTAAVEAVAEAETRGDDNKRGA